MATTVTVVNTDVFQQHREGNPYKGTGINHLGSIRKTDKTMWNLEYDVNADIIVMAQTDASTEGAGPV